MDPTKLIAQLGPILQRFGPLAGPALIALKPVIKQALEDDFDAVFDDILVPLVVSAVTPPKAGA